MIWGSELVPLADGDGATDISVVLVITARGT